MAPPFFNLLRVEQLQKIFEGGRKQATNMELYIRVNLRFHSVFLRGLGGSTIDLFSFVSFVSFVVQLYGSIFTPFQKAIYPAMFFAAGLGSG